MQNNKTYNIKQATEKIQHYCALQDRCQWEVKRKLQEYGLDDFVVESILVDLILEKFVNEQRFSESFCRGKFRIKKWGRIKIKNELKLKNISENCIKKGLKQIEDIEYTKVLEELYRKKRET